MYRSTTRRQKMLPRGCVFGHSFVARFSRSNRQEKGCYARALGLGRACSHLSMTGRGGSFISYFEDFVESLISSRESRMDFLIVDMGTNDLCGLDADGVTLARHYMSCAAELIRRTSVRRVVFALVTPRARTHKRNPRDFDRERNRFNSEIINKSRTMNGVRYFVHGGLMTSEARSWAKDGIHPTTTKYGSNEYYYSIKNVVLQTAKDLRWDSY